MTELPKPYYDKDGITIYCGDCRDILPLLPKVDLVLTDPPYGIGQDKGRSTTVNRTGFAAGGFAHRAQYQGEWDNVKPESMARVIESGKSAIVWGGNYFAHDLPETCHWLVWDKQNTMPTFSDCELAWTNLPLKSVKMLRLNGNGLMAEETQRDHPTQKPLKLMTWCLQRVPNAQTILDPFMGSGTTLVAAKALGRKCIGIEREERYCAIAVQRLSQEVMSFD